MAQLIKTDGTIVKDVAVETLEQQQQLVVGVVVVNLLQHRIKHVKE